MLNESIVTQDLYSFLKERGYSFVQMTKNAVGHFEVDAVLNGHDVRMLVDTGASRTVIDTTLAARLALSLSASEQRAGGVGTADHAVEFADGVSLEAGGIAFARAHCVAVIDLSHVSRSLVAHGGRQIDGAIGGDILAEKNAVIDYAAGRLYLQSAGRPEASNESASN